MATFHFGRTQKALTLVPLAAASAVWTASLVGVTSGSASADQTRGSESSAALPDGSTVPTQAIEAPASVTSNLGPNSGGMVPESSTNGIPGPALAAYQRAETIINSADKSCRLPWQLVAAIGRVESDHGRFGGNVLDGDGVAKPGIYGVALNGKNQTQKISDTDAGQYDKDTTFDRAVGPMQFIPSTWQVVGVDADSDGKRNPQDIDDAALATAVYLCSGKDDLSQTPGQRAAVHRYNHSKAYVDLVLSIMNAYMSGDYVSVPAGTTSGGWIEPDPSYVAPGKGPKGPKGGGLTFPSPGSGSDAGSSGGSTTPDSPTSPAPSAPSAPAPAPSNPLPAPNLPQPSLPSPSLPLPTPTVPPLPSTSVPPLDQTLTYAQASVQCLADIGVATVSQLNLAQLGEYRTCMRAKGF